MALTRPVHRTALYVLAALILTIPRATRADMCAYVVSPGNGEMTVETAVIDVMSQAKVADIYMGHPVAVAIDPKGQAIYALSLDVSMGDGGVHGGRGYPASRVQWNRRGEFGRSVCVPH